MALAACRIAHSAVAAAATSSPALAKPSSVVARPQFSGLRRVELGGSNEFAALAQQLQVRQLQGIG
jgi:hypothetical protein